MSPEDPEEAQSTGPGEPPPKSVYSIGAVAAMVGVPPATLRTWEERYDIVSPSRTLAGHRLYSRVQVEQLRFVAAEIRRGVSAADAHRLLASRASPRAASDEGAASPGPRVLIMVAARDQYSAELVESLLRAEGFQVEPALGVDDAREVFLRTRPDLSLVEFLMGGGQGEDLCRWLKQRSTAPILMLSSLDAADRALQAGADAFLNKPVGHRQLVSTVRDLLGMSAAVREAGETVA